MSFDPGRIVVPDVLAGLGLDARHDGGVWWARCPNPKKLHRDSDPSWKINDRPGTELNGLHYCFACKYHGTTVDLVSDLLEVQIPSAYEWVIERAMGAPIFASSIVVEVGAVRGRAFALPAGVHLLPLESWVGPARAYAAERGITAAQVERWGLGYAADGALNGRLVFPVRDARGRVVGYSARTFAGAPKRYLTARREEGPDFGCYFGEHLWPAGANRFALVVCEGALNALAVDRAVGAMWAAAQIDRAVSALRMLNGVAVGSLGGSNVHLSQILKASTFQRVVVMTDPDMAGDGAAEKIVAALSTHADVARVRLPKGTDANDMRTEELAEWIARGLTPAS